ncbi:flavoprotein [Dactylosporangium sp. NPDC048998]|uniref:flavoprotein n=1 Tax=Dactylosporangium sp. NPDC048998 TaxID=3363976 RepID=UPI0037137FA6
MSGPVLYAVVCGSPATQGVGTLVSLAQERGWDVCVIATPDALKWLDIPALVKQTGHPVRHRYKYPGEPDVLPAAEAMIVAPATVNTVNKWSAGIADTLALGLIVEALGLGLPIVAVPYTNRAMAAHPAFGESIERLRSWGVTVLYGEDVVELHQPGIGETRDDFPWHLPLDTLDRHPSVQAQRIAGGGAVD